MGANLGRQRQGWSVSCLLAGLEQTAKHSGDLAVTRPCLEASFGLLSPPLSPVIRAWDQPASGRQERNHPADAIQSVDN